VATAVRTLFLDDLDGTAGEAALSSAYPPATLARLVDAKRQYDPGNLFRSNPNIRP
jgi:FAD/FMN-containing dehydrogenase